MPAMSDVHVPVFCAEATLQHPCASIQEVGKLVRKSCPPFLVWVPPRNGHMGTWHGCAPAHAMHSPRLEQRRKSHAVAGHCGRRGQGQGHTRHSRPERPGPSIKPPLRKTLRMSPLCPCFQRAPLPLEPGTPAVGPGGPPPPCASSEPSDWRQLRKDAPGKEALMMVMVSGETFLVALSWSRQI